MRPSASACVRSAPAIVVLESARLAMEQSNTTAPLPPLSASPVFGRLRRSGGSKAASHGGPDITLYPNCITWDKDGLDPPPTTRRVQVLEEVMLSHHMERLKPMLTAGSDIGWIIRRTWKRATEQVCQLPRRWSARENKDGYSGFGGLICFTTNDACWRLVDALHRRGCHDVRWKEWADHVQPPMSPNPLPIAAFK
jgi:hypothetical protein